MKVFWNMTKDIHLKFCLLAILVFVQNSLFSQNLEETIYSKTETFIANKNPKSYDVLIKQESAFKDDISSKDEQLAYVFLLCNKAYYLMENNQLPEAISNYENAQKRYNAHKLSNMSDFDITEYCLKPLGNLYTKTNNYTNAENTIKYYINLADKSNNTSHYISGIINLAVLYQTRGMHESVLDLIKQTEKISSIPKRQKEKLHTLKTSSLIALNRSNSTNSNVDYSKSGTTYNEHQLQYELALNQGDYEAALKYHNLAISFQKKDSFTAREIAKTHLEKAQLHYLLTDYKKANQNLEISLQTLLPNLEPYAIPERTSLYAENTFIDIFDLLARLQSNPEKALQYYSLSFYVSNLLTISVTSQESKIANQSANRKRSEYCLDLLFEMYQKTGGLDIFERALNYSENQKASVLKAVFEKKTLLDQHPKDSFLIKEQQLLMQQERLTDVLIKTQLGYEISKNDSLNKQLLDISIQLKTLQNKIALKYPQAETHISISKIRSQLLTDQAEMVVYYYGQRSLYQFIISQENTIFNKIAINEKFKNSVTDFIHLFDNPAAINNNIKAFTSQAFSLYQQLHVGEISSAKNVLIIPDGLLNFLPFEALLTKATESNNFSNMPFVVIQQAVVYNSNIELYLDPQKTSKTKKLLGIFPVFESSNQPLTYSIKEAESIKSATGGTILMHNSATKQSFIETASNYTILHLSTHATGGDFTNPASLAFSDEPMMLNELYSMSINPDLVVLSACETGIGKLQKGEGALSIARGFQYAGAKNVLYSLWQINDASTAQLMTLFYKSFQKTESAFTANRQSKLNYLQDPEISAVKKSPYYWSAFVYYGKLDAPKDTNLTLYYVLGFLTLIFIVFLILRKRIINERKSS
ncbi:CHAT domain-containing protein [Bizionia myxarmorum]|uniref:CHAT domain-containing protein n=2 Tax=Bizionia myxarmorum TaxID=291186 RepID=A0A5D0RCM7_9FLAO|nr:CHAT domain-containing protein [Bizionia myxarmorum]